MYQNTGGYIDRGMKEKVIKKAKSYQLSQLCDSINKAFITKQIEIAKSLIVLTIEKTITKDNKFKWANCIVNSMYYEDIFQIIIDDYRFEDFDVTFYILRNCIRILPHRFQEFYTKATLSGAMNQNMRDELFNGAYGVCQHICEFLLNQGAKYSTNTFIYAVAYNNFALAEELYLSLNISECSDKIVNKACDFCVEFNNESYQYMYNKKMNIDNLLYDDIDYDNSNIRENFITENNKEILSFNIIFQAGLSKGDYKLIEKYLPHIHKKNLILDLCKQCCDISSSIKCYKILFLKLDKIYYDEIKFHNALGLDILNFLKNLMQK